MKSARLLFEDGQVYSGRVFAHASDKSGEVVFNTGMSGYQEILTDPSYCGQMVLMTYPLIGNYGINAEDIESKSLYLNAFLVREYIDFPSNFRSQKTLKTYLEEHDILGVEELDTRAITRHIREAGAQRALLTTSDEPIETLLKKLKATPKMEGQNLAKEVSCKEPYVWPYTPNETPRYKIAVIDCGIKYNILRHLTNNHCACTVFPYNTPAQTILDQNFDGVFISNGPGDPEPVHETIQLIKDILGKLPLFGICLGQQLLGLALGGKTYKLKFGHHGINHPVKNLKNGHVEITSQNHGFNVDLNSLSNEIDITHINLNDQTLEGFRHKHFPAFAVQYHPEAGPGPNDSLYLFQEFTEMIASFQKTGAKNVSK